MARTPQRVDIDNASITPRDGYLEILEKIKKEGLCPFCEENLVKYHPNPIIFKNSHWLVTNNSWPYEGSKHHFLLIARKHIENAEKASPDTWKDLGSAFKKLVKKYDLKGAALFMRTGDTSLTGASVQHLHAQVLVGSTRTATSEPILAVVGFSSKKKSPPSR